MRENLALATGVVLVLVFLPGHPPYYELAPSIAGKTYSNSMMAVLNSRIKAISNAGTLEFPLWNELAQPLGSNNVVGRPSSIVFRRSNETDLET